MIWIVLSGCWMWEGEEELRAVENQHAMEEHYTQGAQARDAVIRGDLEAAHAHLKELRSRLPVASLPPEAVAHEEALVLAVEGAMKAGDLQAASAGVGAVALTCGGCHRSQSVEPLLPTPPLAEGGEMVAHHWVAAQIWSGLVAGTDAAFEQSAEALARAPEFGGDTLSATATPFAGSFQALAERAVAPGASGQQRAIAYGELLETCAACHKLTGGGGEP